MFELKPNERLFAVQWHINDYKDPTSGVYWFAVDNSVATGEEEDSLKKVIHDYYAACSEEQEEMTRGYDPNWGDAINEVEFDGSAFRLIDLPRPNASTHVDHDELVFELYKHLCKKKR